MKKRPKRSSDAVEAQTIAAKGLRMPSETDAPFEVFAWDDSGDRTPGRVLQLAQRERPSRRLPRTISSPRSRVRTRRSSNACGRRFRGSSPE
jgi:hypothetical protein